MTAPTPEQLRVLADDVQHTVDNGYEFAPDNVVAALRAAANEVDRLRSRVVELKAMVVATSTDRRRLRAVIENAPHQYPCPHQTRAWLVGRCTCWKAEAL